ncbi:MAG: NAD(P)/FAD-dependent oxidoreductase [Methanobacteriota archaeon]
MAPKTDFDVIVAGGGPGGAACASFLARDGLHVLLLEKARFPRDKACGDAISGKSISVLRELGLTEAIEARPHASALGVLFSSPKGDTVEIPFPKKVDPASFKRPDKHNYINPGYVARRLVFDDIVFQHAKSYKNVTTLEEHEVTDVLFEGTRAVGVKVRGKGGPPREFRAKVVVGADGAQSVVAQKVGAYDRDPDHWIGAFRIYYEGVSGLTDNIEIHFVPDLLPGYFWIFPLDNGLANVGAGMIESDLKPTDGHAKPNMKETTYRLIREHPMFKERFQGAKEVPNSFRGWLLPLGSKRRRLTGDGWVLVGDAASLIDPFSGEGIGNALVSARHASRVISQAIAANDVGRERLSPYEAALWHEIGDEIDTSYKLQKLGRHTWLLNWVIRRAATKPAVRNAISDMLADREKKQALTGMWWYAKLLLT